VDRRKIEYVESHLRDVVEPLDRRLQRPVGDGLSGRAAREHLVPRAEAGPNRVDRDRERPRPGRERPVRDGTDESDQILVERVPGSFLNRSVARLEEIRRGHDELLCRCVRTARSGALQQSSSDREIDVGLRINLDLLAQPVDPRVEVIDPGLDRVLPAPEFGHSNVPEPGVVAQRQQLDLLELFLPGATVPRDRADQIVSVGVDVGTHRHEIPNNDPLGRIASSVDRRPYILQYCPFA